jgi:hypothetical protein
MPAPSPSKVEKSSMTMSPSLKAATSQTSIVRMVLPMPHRLRHAGRHLQVVPQVSGGGGIAAGDADQVAAAVAEVAGRSKH